MQHFKLGLCGLGRVAKYHVAALDDANRGIELVAACDPEEDPLTSPPVPVYSSLKEMMASEALDAVALATPNDTHADLARTALEGEKHVLVEKPATPSYEELEALIDVAATMNLHLHTSFHAAYAPDVLWCADHIDEMVEQFGELTAFHARYFDPYVTDGDLYNRATSLGGSWVDSGINALSVLDQILDTFRITNLHRARLPNFNCEDVQALAEVSFPSFSDTGRGRGTIHTNWLLETNFKTTVLTFGESGVEVQLDHSNHAVRRIGPNGESSLLASFPAGEMKLALHYEEAYGEFYDVLAGSRHDNRKRSLRLHRLLFSK